MLVEQSNKDQQTKQPTKKQKHKTDAIGGRRELLDNIFELARGNGITAEGESLQGA